MTATRPPARIDGEIDGPARSSVVLDCRDPEIGRFVGGYLRYLAPGLTQLDAQPVRLRLRLARPERIPRLPGAAQAVRRYRNYETATAGGHVLYSSERGGFVRVAPAASRVAICVSRPAGSDRRFLMELVSLGLLEVARHRGLYGLHTAAVTRDGAGCLLPGPSGSGKTSLALALVRHGGYQYVTDDFVLLAGGPADVRCLPLFRTFNLDPMWVAHYSELSFITDLPPLENGKRNFDPELQYRGSRVGECRPAFIVFPRIVAAPRSTVQPIPRLDAFRRLLRESPLSPDPGIARCQLAILGTLVRQAVTYEFLHGRDFLDDPGRTIQVLIEHVRPGAAVSDNAC